MSEFIVDIKKIDQNVNLIKDRLAIDKFYYSLKANSSLFVLEELQKIGCFFEIASINEYNKVIEIGTKSKDIICGIPVKPIELLKKIGNEELEYFVFDDICEYDKLVRYANRNKKVMRIYVSDIDHESAPWGIKSEDFEAIIAKNNEFIQSVSGLTFHIARNYQVQKIGRVFDRIEKFLKYFGDRKLIVNLGGGFRGELPPHLALKYDLNQYYECVNERILKVRDKFSVDFFCEPGRGIVQSACHIITDIELVTEKEGKAVVFINLNIGIPVGSHPYKITIMYDGEEEEIYNIERHMSREYCENIIQTTFVDTICEYESFFTLPLEKKLYIGDRIKMYGMGAYTTVRSSVFHMRDLLRVKSENKDG
ncbi:hypothetical protein QA584_26500 [Anaerocolumna sp. AGMB13025]|uniref:hypothetical protein n=1 Tax=Anaerocolumna sp. AGMB13025 TaxID=3039116 RepID=UPI00241E82C8|nr:hypothetical protein [Anaerocolumna sp. AGMB13025]WFR57120.1 hypothetical protein QA584_26500 [Anaerocolumna sp. AGMB13025]